MISALPESFTFYYFFISLKVTFDSNSSNERAKTSLDTLIELS